MGKLIYLITTSLDGYSADAEGKFDWAEPSEAVHAHVNRAVSNVGTYLFGRQMYETMKVWDDIPVDGDSPAINEFATHWQTTNKIVYSSSLTELDLANGTLESSFDPSAVRGLVAASAKDVGIGGPHLAAEAIKAGIIDEYHQVIIPVLVGGGTPWLPRDVHATLELVDCQKFENGAVYLRYKNAVS